MRRLLGLVLLVLFTGCTDLQTEYGDRTLGSINGVRVLYARCDEAFSLREIPRLGKRTDTYDLLIHVALYQGLPDAETLLYLEQWLAERPQRQVVLILRDGTMTPWLCRRWAEELRAVMAQAPEGEREALRRQIERLNEHAMYDNDAEFPFFVAEQVAGPLQLRSTPVVTAERVHGLIDRPAPPFMDLRYTLTADAGQPLMEVDDRAWALAIPYESSRMVVVSSGQPLVDAAQVDRTSRRMLAALLADVQAFAGGRGSSIKAAWVRRLVVGTANDPPPPNILAMLFGRPPFNYVVIHLLVLVIAFIAVKALWLGRTEAPPTGDLQRFRRHVDAFAEHLRRAGATREVITALTQVVRRQSRPASSAASASSTSSVPPAVLSVSEAFAAAQALYVEPSSIDHEQGPPHA